MYRVVSKKLFNNKNEAENLLLSVIDCAGPEAEFEIIKEDIIHD